MENSKIRNTASSHNVDTSTGMTMENGVGVRAARKKRRARSVTAAVPALAGFVFDIGSHVASFLLIRGGAVFVWLVRSQLLSLCHPSPLLERCT